MATKGYVLIETAIGKTREVVNALRKTAGISSVDAVTGPYDAIAIAEAADLNALGELITKKIHTASGVTRTITCLSIELS